MDKATLELLSEVIVKLARLQVDRVADITDASDFEKEDGFYLYVGVEGNVTFTDMFGTTLTKHLVVGYHPIKMKSITGATTAATDLIACF